MADLRKGTISAIANSTAAIRASVASANAFAKIVQTLSNNVTRIAIMSDAPIEESLPTQIGDATTAPGANTVESLQQLSEIIKKNPTTLVPLTGLLNLEGKPYSLENHFPFEPIFSLKLPRTEVWKCGRQVSKSTSLTGSGFLRLAGCSHLKMLFITPRYEQVRRLSNNYFRPFVTNSLIKDIVLNTECVDHVLQRSFANQSIAYFSFAFLSADRVRGLPSDINIIDEFQDFDYDFLSVVSECMSASKLGVSIYSGTPKTLDNGMEAAWGDSSKAEWVTRCEGCGYWSMASIQADLTKMIGSKTVVCAKCQKPINPRNGHWYHTDSSHANYLGYHVPQIIMPMHCENPEKWGVILGKRDGHGNYSPQKFLNEVLGESCDVGVRLMTLTDIKEVSILGKNNFAEACRELTNRCSIRVMGVDWGGGGEEEVSFTTVALCGYNNFSNKVECHYAFRFHAAYTHDEEVKELLKIFRGAGCHYFAHDYGGSGSVRETLMIQAGLPIDKIVNLKYVAASASHIVVYKPAPHNELRGYWSLDKARSLVLMATCIKAKNTLLPNYEQSKDVTHDLLNLIEDKHERPAGADIYLIKRRPKCSDDFAHSLNFASMAIYHTQQCYPDLSKIQGLKLSAEQMMFAAQPSTWRDSE